MEPLPAIVDFKQHPVTSGFLILQRDRDAAGNRTRFMTVDGVVQVDTPAGADYVFLPPENMNFENAKVAFDGRAGSIGVRDDSVRFVMAERGGARPSAGFQKWLRW